jgi:hypothetical protein
VLARIYHNVGQVNYMLSDKRLSGDGGSADVAGCISKVFYFKHLSVALGLSLG